MFCTREDRFIVGVMDKRKKEKILRHDKNKTQDKNINKEGGKSYEAGGF